MWGKNEAGAGMDLRIKLRVPFVLYGRTVGKILVQYSIMYNDLNVPIQNRFISFPNFQINKYRILGKSVVRYNSVQYIFLFLCIYA